MSETKDNLGFGNKYNENERRLFNKDGSLNVKKKGVIKGTKDIFIYLIEMSWSKFLLLLLGSFFLLNILFALVYFFIGVENLNGVMPGSSLENYLSCLHFSSQTFTTVGYGAISPTGIVVNLIASTEAMTGLLSFSLATGLLFGRFSRPNLKLKFSENILISDYKKNDGKGLMFKVSNKRNTILLDTSVEIIATTFFINNEGEISRDFQVLDLEIKEIKIFPSAWTVVHPINSDSFFYKNTLEELKEKNLEILVMIKSHDETFGQTIHARTSYKGDEIIENANFIKSSVLNKDGIVEVDISKIGDFVKK